MSAAKQLDIKNHLLNNAAVLGNSKTDFTKLASDLVNSMGRAKGVRQRMSDATFLSVHTLERVATLKDTETGRPYLPAADTLNRIFIYFNVEFRANQTVIKSKFLNQPKPWL